VSQHSLEVDQRHQYLVAGVALLACACTGLLDGKSQPEPAPANPTPNQTATGGSGGATTKAPTPTPSSTEPAAAPFKVRNTEPELVPFDMRLRRIASAIGVDINNPMFDTMYKNSLKLGDYDYANGALPDGSWNANRIAGWIDSLKPVCASAEMKAKYPALPENLPQLVRAAWGHVPSEQDTADFKDAVTAAGADPAVTYESTCMAVFTAAEFVYR
jgi:hypothetical protein